MESVEFVFLSWSLNLIQELNAALEKHVPDKARSSIVTVHSGLSDFHDSFDCIMSPANSYGRLDGGFDHFISEALAPADDYNAATRVAQALLYQKWKGYAPPGTCTLVPLAGTACENNKHRCAYIALCPTMRIPSSVSWNREIVYNCMWSLLNTLANHNAEGNSSLIQKVLLTGLATGVGHVPEKLCAEQMALAIRDFADATARPEVWGNLEWRDAMKIAADTENTYTREEKQEEGPP